MVLRGREKWFQERKNAEGQSVRNNMDRASGQRKNSTNESCFWRMNEPVERPHFLLQAINNHPFLVAFFALFSVLRPVLSTDCVCSKKVLMASTGIFNLRNRIDAIPFSCSENLVPSPSELSRNRSSHRLLVSSLIGSRWRGRATNRKSKAGTFSMRQQGVFQTKEDC